MPKAARLGDLTSHGGIIVSGCATVLIEGQPAARIGDYHLCPMCNPGTPPPPHLGGPIQQGCINVLIGGSAAATVGDACSCMGSSDKIVQGSMSVIIGDGKSSSENTGVSRVNGLVRQISQSAIAALDIGT